MRHYTGTYESDDKIMSHITLIFVFIIAICTFITILFSSIAAKLGRLESSQKELDFQLKQQEDGAEEAMEAYKTHLAVYNESISRFPGMLIARVYGFRTISAKEEEEFDSW